MGIAWFLVGALAAGCALPVAAPGQATPPASLRQPESAAVIEAKVAQAPTRAIPVRLTILHTNDVRGAVEPCG
jgi:2',3'-cyclic-nucleotide 2'-phosphodiesterase (5'-nucleotidase family)